MNWHKIVGKKIKGNSRKGRVTSGWKRERGRYFKGRGFQLEEIKKNHF